MVKWLIYLLVLLISLVSVNAILPDIFCEVFDSDGIFCYGDNTIYPSILTNGGTRGENRTSATWLRIMGSLNVTGEIKADTGNIIEISSDVINIISEKGSKINITHLEGGYLLLPDGVDDGFNAGDIQEIDDATEITFCTWVWNNDLDTDGVLIGKWLANNGFFFWQDDSAATSGRLNTYSAIFYESSGTGIVRFEASENAAKAEVWQHICVTFRENSDTTGTNGIHFYVDGVEDSASPMATTGIIGIDSGARVIAIGYDINALVADLDGRLDEVMIFNKSLTSIQILAINDSGMDFGCYSGTAVADLVSQWRFDDGTLKDCNDKYDGTIVGDATVEGITGLIFRSLLGFPPIRIGNIISDLYSIVEGVITAVSLTLSGNIIAVNAVFSGTVNAVDGTFSDDLTTETFSSGEITDDGGSIVYISGDLDVGNDVDLGGKLTSIGGNDPPYVLYNIETRQSIINRTREEITMEKAGGMAQFYNSELNRYEHFKALTCEFYVEAYDDKSFESYLKLIYTWDDGQVCYNQNSTTRYYYDMITDTIKSYTKAVYTNSFPKDKKLNKTTGEITDKPVIEVFDEFEGLR